MMHVSSARKSRANILYGKVNLFNFMSTTFYEKGGKEYFMPRQNRIKQKKSLTDKHSSPLSMQSFF